METLLIEATEDSPKILFNAEEGHFFINGRSFMEDTNPFYFGIMEWSREYFKNPQKNTLLELEFDYINSASQRMLLDIVGEFNKYYIMGYRVKIIWNFLYSDEGMAELGEEMQEIFDVPVVCRQLAK
ncbi:MAG: DUF1987 domain-containing protein [Bacteroidota bacterium]